MALNLLSPTGLNCLLIGDTVQAPGGSSDSIPSITTIDVDGIFTPVSAALEIKSTEGALLLPRMTEDQRDDLLTTPGMVLYNETSGEYNFNIGEDAWISISEVTGDVTGPDEAVVGDIVIFNSTDGKIVSDSNVHIDTVVLCEEAVSVESNIPVYANTTGNLLADSGVSITQVPELLIRGRREDPPPHVNQIGNIGYINFTGDNGSIFLDGLPGVQLFDNDGTSITVLMSGGGLENTTTTSALLELKSTTQALLLSRMTTAQMNALVIPENGMILYNTDDGAVRIRQEAAWEQIATQSESNSSYPPTYTQQAAIVSTGWNQGGFGSSSPGTNIQLAANYVTNYVYSGGFGSQYFGSIAAGNYIYFIPTNTGKFLRYNKSLPFESNSSYEIFDMNANVSFYADSFWGGCFDGRYIYFAKRSTAPSVAVPGPETPGPATFVLRYDTFSDNFSDPTSYEGLDVTSVTGVDVSYRGAVFDGRYVYYVPYNEGGGLSFSSKVLRYDTQASFQSTGSFSVYDAFAANINRFNGGAWDGQYVYFIPNAASGKILRYNTASDAGFTNSSSWQSYDLVAQNASWEGFYGAVFDGRWLFLVPHDNSVVARYDTQASFTSSGSWIARDLSTLPDILNANDFSGGVFDGRYIYYMNGQNTNTCVRYDTTKQYHNSGSDASYQFLNFGSSNNSGGVYDGKYIYQVGPTVSTRVQVYSGPPIPFSSLNGSG